jgi:hypothetical protein
LGLLLLPDPKPDLLIILKPLVAPHGEDILIEVIKLLITTEGYDPQKIGSGWILIGEYVLPEVDADFDFVNGARIQDVLVELDRRLVDLDQVLREVLLLLVMLV